MEFKDRLKQLRQEKRLTQESLGRAIHVSRSAIAKWEAGLGIPSEDSVIALCAYFHVERKELFPNLGTEELLVEKNVKIRRHKRSIVILIAIMFALISFISLFSAWQITNHVEREEKNQFLKAYIPTVNQLYFYPAFPLDPIVKEGENYVIPQGEWVEVFFEVKIDRLFDGSWLEFTPKFEDFECFFAEKTSMRYIEDNSVCLLRYGAFIRVQNENVTELALSELVFAHVVDGIWYEKACVINVKPLPVVVRQNFVG